MSSQPFGGAVFRAGDVVELARDLGAAARQGTRGVVLREPGVLSRRYVVRLDPDGRKLELAGEALRPAVDGVWSMGGAWSIGAWGRPARSHGKDRRASRAEEAQASPRSSSSSPVPTASRPWRGPGRGAGRLPATAAPVRRRGRDAIAELRARLSRPARERAG